jgi:threonine dehydrogenase-like Zn-dependent dehydrogenase
MKVLLWCGGSLLALEDVPEPGPGEVVAQVVLAGICGSDLHAYRGHDTARTPPLVLRHEAVARTPGGSRAIFPLIGCDACRACRRREHSLCERRMLMGLNRPQGAEAFRRMTSDLDSAVKVLLRAGPETELPQEASSAPATATRHADQPASRLPLN